MAAFHRIQELGTTKFQRIVNELMRGTPAQTLARLIQQEWGDAREVEEETLSKQLMRLRKAVSDGAFGGDLAQRARESASVKIKLLHGSSLNCLDELGELAELQKQRVIRFFEIEEGLDRPIPELSKMIMTWATILASMQEMKFNLGIDEYHRRIPVKPPTDAETSEALQKAIAVAEEIFKKRWTM